MNDQDQPLTPRVTDEQVAALPLGRARAELMEEIMATTTDKTTDNRTEPVGTGGHRPRWGVVVAAAAAIALIVAVPVWWGSRGDNSNSGPATGTTSAPSDTSEPASSPRPYAVLDAAGWEVDNVDGQPSDGEIHYEKGDQELDINWRPADSYDGYVEDRSENGAAQSAYLVSVVSKLWDYDALDHTTIRPVDGDTFLEVRGTGMDRAAYGRLLDQVVGVDADGFGASLPDEIVLPDEVSATVAGMLDEVTLPPGFDDASVEVEPFQESYGVGVAVSTGVTCGWVDAYDQAVATGDTDVQQRAVEAMRGSRRWSWLTAMKASGDWPSSIYGVARAMTDGQSAAEAADSLGLGC